MTKGEIDVEKGQTKDIQWKEAYELEKEVGQDTKNKRRIKWT
jgi:hypothetical protein